MQTVTPAVISASRTTDIPAFHAAWFMERLREGFCLWRNPYNSRHVQRVSFARCRCIVFWSKNPAPLLPYLDELSARGVQWYMNYTLNDYKTEGLEPLVPPLPQRVETFMQLAAHGRDRVIWRWDPVITGGNLTIDVVLERLSRLGQAVHPYTRKLVFSFLDMYSKTRANLARVNAALHAPTPEEQHSFMRGLVAVNAGWSQPLTLASCAEATQAEDICPNACVDADRINRLCGADVYATGPVQHTLPLTGPTPCGLKDKGQRRLCQCAPSKDIGTYNTCLHLCAYCYANVSEARVRATLNASAPHAAMLGGQA